MNAMVHKCTQSLKIGVTGEPAAECTTAGCNCRLTGSEVAEQYASRQDDGQGASWASST